MTVPADRADPDLAPADPHVRADLRVPPRHPVDAIYRAAGFEWGIPPGIDLAAGCDQCASIPLLFQPGTEWNYSVSTDVLGRVVEVVSGQTLDEFFGSRIFEPLGMTETGFCVRDARPTARQALRRRPPRERRRDAPDGPGGRRRPELLGGGGGLISTAADYHRFAHMLLGRGTAANWTACGCSARARSTT